MLRESIPIWLRGPRSLTLLVITFGLLLLLGALAPAKLLLVLYKLVLVAVAAVIGYWLDRLFFPYARPDGYLVRDWRLGTLEPHGSADYPVVCDHVQTFNFAMLRRAIIVAAAILGITLGL